MEAKEAPRRILSHYTPLMLFLVIGLVVLDVLIFRALFVAFQVVNAYAVALLFGAAPILLLLYRPKSGPSAAGYVIVLVGVVGWVVGCFLPFPGGADPFRRIWFGGEGSVKEAGALLFLFAGAATVAILALWGISRRQAWTPRALVAGTAAWTPPWIGVLINHLWVGIPIGVGYWVLLASLGVAILGTAVVLASAEAHTDRRATGAPSIAA